MINIMSNMYKLDNLRFFFRAIQEIPLVKFILPGNSYKYRIEKPIFTDASYLGKHLFFKLMVLQFELFELEILYAFYLSKTYTCRKNTFVLFYQGNWKLERKLINSKLNVNKNLS